MKLENLTAGYVEEIWLSFIDPFMQCLKSQKYLCLTSSVLNIIVYFICDCLPIYLIFF